METKGHEILLEKAFKKAKDFLLRVVFGCFWLVGWLVSWFLREENNEAILCYFILQHLSE